MIDSVLLLSILTIFSGILGLSIRYCFRSKCSTIKCCFGLCTINRDVARELELDKNLKTRGKIEKDEITEPSSP